MLEAARLLTADPIVRVDVDQLRAWIELSVGSGMMARRLLIDAAKEIADIDPDRALEMLSAAAEAAWVAGDAQAGAELAWLPRGWLGRHASGRFLTHLVNGFVGLLNGGVARPVRALREAMDLAGEPDPDLVVRAGHVAFYLGDDDAAYRLNAQTVAAARATGAIGELLFALPPALAEILTGRRRRPRSAQMRLSGSRGRRASRACVRCRLRGSLCSRCSPVTRTGSSRC